MNAKSLKKLLVIKETGTWLLPWLNGRKCRPQEHASLINNSFNGGATGRSLDLRSTGRGFKSYSGQKLRNNLGQVVHTYVPLSQSSITWYQSRGGNALRLGR